MPNPNIASLASQGGRARARSRLTLDRVEAELGALDSLEDAQRWLRRLCLWGAGGLLPGAVLGGCVRAVDQWIRAHESKLTREVVDNLRARVNELEGLTRPRGER